MHIYINDFIFYYKKMSIQHLKLNNKVNFFQTNITFFIFCPSERILLEEY
jgi:hypothetical protein